MDPLRPHVLGRDRHRLVAQRLREAPVSSSRRLDGLVSVLKRRAFELADGAHRRSHARHARRADHLRDKARPGLPAGRPRPYPAPPGPRGHPCRQAVRAPSARTRTSTRSSSSYVCEALGLRPVPATQVIARDRHGEYLYACAALGTTIEAIATEIRHLQRTEVAEVEEPFTKGQKGSSAMPHKRNPIDAERLERSCPRPARLSRLRPRGRRPLARARHFPQLGGAHRAPRRQPGRLLLP